MLIIEIESYGRFCYVHGWGGSRAVGPAPLGASVGIPESPGPVVTRKRAPGGGSVPDRLLPPA